VEHAKEQVVGCCIVDCNSRDRAVEIATRWPDAWLWGMEVRPILSPGDRAAAGAGYAGAARAATSLPERRYLEARAAELAPAGTRDAGAGDWARDVGAAGRA
jgi:hypothetical protein